MCYAKLGIRRAKDIYDDEIRTSHDRNSRGSRHVKARSVRDCHAGDASQGIPRRTAARSILDLVMVPVLSKTMVEILPAMGILLSESDFDGSHVRTTAGWQPILFNKSILHWSLQYVLGL